MTRNPWSGLAPAVDAHLARWAIIDRIAAMAERVAAGGQIPQEELARIVSNAYLEYWIGFAATYGHQVQGENVMIATSLGGHTNESVEVVRDKSYLVNSRDVAISYGAVLAIREHEMLAKAVTHYVSAPVVAEVNAFVAAMEPEPLFDTDLFTPVGLAILEAPLMINDFNVETGLIDENVWLAVRAIGWHRHGEIGSYVTGDRGEGVTLFIYSTRSDLGDSEDRFRPDELLPLDVVPWRFNVGWSTREAAGQEYVPGEIVAPVSWERRWFLAFMRLCWQEIVVRHPHHEARAERRRWERLAKRKPLLDYTVLRLRREFDLNPPAPTGLGVGLDHRVLVREHPRRQWYPSLGPARNPDGSFNRDSHRLIWVEAHWRGPEDAPIGAMHHATAFVR